MRILFIVPYAFVPPRSGNQTLTFNLLKHVSAHATCDIAVLVERGVAANDIEARLRREYEHVRDVFVFHKVRGPKLLLARLRALSRGYHPALGRHWSGELARWLRRRAADCEYDVIHFDMVHTVTYRRYCAGVASVLVASDAYSRAARIAGPLKSSVVGVVSTYIQEVLLRRIERAEYGRFGVVCTVSDVDAAYLRQIAAGASVARIGIALGKDFSDLQRRDHVSLEPVAFQGILCTGTLNDEAVANGVLACLTYVLPALRDQGYEGDVTLLGRNPTRKLMRFLKRNPSVRHIDWVPDYPELLNRDWVYVYPQVSGTGLQTKVQQAMAAGLPVVGFDVIKDGLGITSGETGFICSNLDEMITALLMLVRSVELRQRIGRAAAEYVRQRFSLERVGDEMMALYRGITRENRASDVANCRVS